MLITYVQLFTTKSTSLKTRHLGKDFTVEALLISRLDNGRYGKWSMLEARFNNYS
jgi:hypothetical protein